MIAADVYDTAARAADLIKAHEQGKVLLHNGIAPVEPEIKDVSGEDEQVIFTDCLF